MKSQSKIIRNITISLLITAVLPFVASAQATTTNDTASAIAAGQQLWQQLQSKQISCSGLSDSNFENLGEYFMDQMMGSSHESMNQFIASRFGQNGEEQMHIFMGKRFSGCDPSAALPASMQGFMPMIGMMGAGSNYHGSNYSNNMMGYYGYGPSMMDWGGFGWIFMILWWMLIIAGIIALVRWISGRPHRWSGSNALDILKERYAKGEIDKQEFEEKKKDLSSLH